MLFVAFGVLVALFVAAFVLEAKYRPAEPLSAVVPAGSGFLHGRITKSTGWAPLALPGIVGASVTLDPGGYAATTDANGRFTIRDVEPGVYAVLIEAEGAETALIERIAIGTGYVTSLPEYALFPEPEGPPVARLRLTGPMPFLPSPEVHPYRSAVHVDAGESENLSRNGIRFEIRDADGLLLTDPWSDGEVLRPTPSSVPGVSPAVFSFKLPRPGTFMIKMIVTNEQFPAAEDVAEVTVQSVNVAPEAVAKVIAGPDLPQKTPAARVRASSGLRVVRAGDEVYLAGQGVDVNHASPERYNPDGFAPDLYGKNHNHRQTQFGFTWELRHTDTSGGRATDVDHLLRSDDTAAPMDGQVVHFTAATPGLYEAVLQVSDNDPYESLTSEPASVAILVVDDDAHQDGTACESCHAERVKNYRRTAHNELGVGCDSCHGPAAEHLEADSDAQLKRVTQSVSREAGVCGQCHTEYPEWEKSRHSDGLPFGHLEVAAPLRVQCGKCHFARTFETAVEAASTAGLEFHDIDYKSRIAGIGPLMPDHTMAPESGEAGVTCVACHAPHDAVRGKSAGLRTESAGALCQTCHEEKWQNTILEATAGEVGNGFEYPGEDYDVFNPHRTDGKCVACHLGDANRTLDVRHVRAVGGHTLRMRDAGGNAVLGGFGPRPNDASDKNPDETDDVLHLEACRDCHGDVESFDVNGRQSEIHARWQELGRLLEAANAGVLPGVRPGDKCATCHRGGTQPFDDDPGLVLENAYTNYKLVMNDRSWGVHNPGYVSKLLGDSIAAVEQYVATHGL